MSGQQQKVVTILAPRKTISQPSSPSTPQNVTPTPDQPNPSTRTPQNVITTLNRPTSPTSAPQQPDQLAQNVAAATLPLSGTSNQSNTPTSTRPPVQPTSPNRATPILKSISPLQPLPNPVPDLGDQSLVYNLRNDADPDPLQQQIFQENAAWYADMIQKGKKNEILWPAFLEDFRKHFPDRGSAITFGPVQGTIILAFRSRQNLRTTKVKLEFFLKQEQWVLKEAVAIKTGPPPPSSMTRKQLDEYGTTYGGWIAKWLSGQIGIQLKDGNYGECTMVVSEAIKAFANDPTNKAIPPPMQTVWFNHGYCIYMQRGRNFDGQAFHDAHIGPGDVIQYYSGLNIDASSHTAVITEVVSVGIVRVLHQNAGNGANKLVVHEDTKDLTTEKTSIEIYRIMPGSWVESYVLPKWNDW
jgi:hypothetical protein